MVMRTTCRPSAEVIAITEPASTVAVPPYWSQSGDIEWSNPLTGGCARSAGLASRRRARWNAALTLTRLAPSLQSRVVAAVSVVWRAAQRLGLTNSVERCSEFAWRGLRYCVVRSIVSPPGSVASDGRR